MVDEIVGLRGEAGIDLTIEVLKQVLGVQDMGSESEVGEGLDFVESKVDFRVQFGAIPKPSRIKRSIVLSKYHREYKYHRSDLSAQLTTQRTPKEWRGSSC